MFTIYTYISMENRIFTRLEQERVLDKNISIMEKETLGSKIDSENWYIVPMSLFCDMYKESISPEYHIGSFPYGSLEESHRI
jgi:hypothetical protein